MGKKSRAARHARNDGGAHWYATCDPLVFRECLFVAITPVSPAKPAEERPSLRFSVDGEDYEWVNGPDPQEPLRIKALLGEGHPQFGAIMVRLHLMAQVLATSRGDSRFEQFVVYGAEKRMRVSTALLDAFATVKINPAKEKMDVKSLLQAAKRNAAMESVAFLDL